MSNKVKMKFGQIEFEVEGDEKTIERERKAFIDLLPKVINEIGNANTFSSIDSINKEDSNIIDSPVYLNESDSSNSILNQSVSEFLLEKTFASDLDAFLGLAYYNEKVKSKAFFSNASLKELYKEGRIPIPSNISNSALKNVQKGYLQPIKIEGDNTKYYQLTSNGLKYIEKYASIDSEQNKKPAKKNVKKTRKITKDKIQYSSITKKDLNLGKYIKISSLSDFKDKMIYSMYIIKSEGKGEYFSVNEVIYILKDIFSEKATIDQVNGVFKRCHDWFDKVKDPNELKGTYRRLMREGIEYATSLSNNT